MSISDPIRTVRTVQSDTGYSVKAINYMIKSLGMEGLPPIRSISDLNMMVLARIHCELLGMEYGKDFILTGNPEEDAGSVVASLRETYGPGTFQALDPKQLAENHPTQLRYLVENYHLINNYMKDRAHGGQVHKTETGSHLMYAKPAFNSTDESRLLRGSESSVYMFPAPPPPNVESPAPASSTKRPKSPKEKIALNKRGSSHSPKAKIDGKKSETQKAEPMQASQNPTVKKGKKTHKKPISTQTSRSFLAQNRRRKPETSKSPLRIEGGAGHSQPIPNPSDTKTPPANANKGPESNQAALTSGTKKRSPNAKHKVKKSGNRTPSRSPKAKRHRSPSAKPRSPAKANMEGRTARGPTKVSRIPILKNKMKKQEPNPTPASTDKNPSVTNQMQKQEERPPPALQSPGPNNEAKNPETGRLSQNPKTEPPKQISSPSKPTSPATANMEGSKPGSSPRSTGEDGKKKRTPGPSQDPPSPNTIAAKQEMNKQQSGQTSSSQKADPPVPSPSNQGTGGQKLEAQEKIPKAKEAGERIAGKNTEMNKQSRIPIPVSRRPTGENEKKKQESPGPASSMGNEGQGSVSKPSKSTTANANVAKNQTPYEGRSVVGPSSNMKGGTGIDNSLQTPPSISEMKGEQPGPESSSHKNDPLPLVYEILPTGSENLVVVTPSNQGTGNEKALSQDKISNSNKGMGGSSPTGKNEINKGKPIPTQASQSAIRENGKKKQTPGASEASPAKQQPGPTSTSPPHIVVGTPTAKTVEVNKQQKISLQAPPTPPVIPEMKKQQPGPPSTSQKNKPQINPLESTGTKQPVTVGSIPSKGTGSEKSMAKEKISKPNVVGGNPTGNKNTETNKQTPIPAQTSSQSPSSTNEMKKQQPPPTSASQKEVPGSNAVGSTGSKQPVVSTPTPSTGPGSQKTLAQENLSKSKGVGESPAGRNPEINVQKPVQASQSTAAQIGKTNQEPPRPVAGVSSKTVANPTKSTPSTIAKNPTPNKSNNAGSSSNTQGETDSDDSFQTVDKMVLGVNPNDLTTSDGTADEGTPTKTNNSSSASTVSPTPGSKTPNQGQSALGLPERTRGESGNGQSSSTPSEMLLAVVIPIGIITTDDSAVTDSDSQPLSGMSSIYSHTPSGRMQQRNNISSHPSRLVLIPSMNTASQNALAKETTSKSKGVDDLPSSSKENQNVQPSATFTLLGAQPNKQQPSKDALAAQSDKQQHCNQTLSEYLKQTQEEYELMSRMLGRESTSSDCDDLGNNKKGKSNGCRRPSQNSDSRWFTPVDTRFPYYGGSVIYANCISTKRMRLLKARQQAKEMANKKQSTPSSSASRSDSTTNSEEEEEEEDASSSDSDEEEDASSSDSDSDEGEDASSSDSDSDEGEDASSSDSDDKDSTNVDTLVELPPPLSPVKASSTKLTEESEVVPESRGGSNPTSASTGKPTEKSSFRQKYRLPDKSKMDWQGKTDKSKY